MVVAGLTGNYGMGKSTVMSLFRKLGAYTLNSDDIVAGLLMKKGVIARIKGMFGVTILNSDGTIDKKILAERVFTSNVLRRRLEALLHPLVMKHVSESIARIKGHHSIIIVEVPLLFEGRFQDRFDTTITVFTNRKNALARLKKKGIGRKNALLRLNAQIPIQSKKKQSDYCIDNNGTKRQTEAQVRKVFQTLCNEDTLHLRRGQRRS